MKTIKLTTISAVLISSVVLGGTVFAGESGGTRNTDTQIMFEENTEPVDPVDPTDPTNPVDPVDPIDPEKPIEPGTGGPLSLDYASALNFWKQKIVSTDEEYFAKTQTIKDKDGTNEREVPLYVQITDNRGTLKGWTLSVKQNGQFKAGENVLTGAKIDFLNGVMTTVSESPVPSMVKESFDLTGDGTGAVTNVMAANESEGSGTYVYQLGNDATKGESVKISVPGKTIKMKDVAYKTTLTWTLNDIPENPEVPEIPEVEE